MLADARVPAVLLAREHPRYAGEMRYLIQFLIPAIILLAVVYLLGRNRRGRGEDDDRSRETMTFILILVVGAAVAVASFFALEAFLT